MQWLYPAGAWGLISLAVITALYLLRRKSESVTVPSLLLWQRAAAEQQAMRPFQKLKKNILYFLQMALAALLALALLRPALRGGLQGETVMILDLSASMQAVEAGESRLQTAQRQALTLLEGMREGDRVTVITAAGAVSTPLSRSTDLTRARSVIEGLAAQNGGADMEAAVSLAQAMARDIPGLNILVFSDVYESDSVQVVRAGAGAENRALLSLSLSPTGQAFARVANYGAEARLTVECFADDRLCDAVTLDMAAGETRSVLLTARADAQRVRAVIREKDALEADNERWYAAGGEESYRVALCAANVFVEKALLLREDMVLLRAEAEEAAELEQIDLYVFDGALPQTMPPAGALLCLAPDREVAGIGVGPTVSAPGRLRAGTGERARQITRHLLLEDVALRKYTPLEGGEAVLLWNDAPLLCLSFAEGRRTAVLGFDLHDSNLPMLADFPVLIQEVLHALLPEMRSLLAGGVCGQTLELPADSRSQGRRVILPSGASVRVEERLEDPQEQGIYALQTDYGTEGTRTVYFAVHMENGESDVRSVGGPGSADVTRRVQAEEGRELTGWILMAFLALLLVEWGVSRRVA